MKLSDVDLSDPEFWIAPIEVREAAFKTLREEAPISFTEEFEPPPDMPLPKGPGYWSLTRHRHILEASRNPEVFCSGKGATSVIDMPEQMLEFFGGMINMDEPRHTKQRKIISRGFTPRSLKRIEDAVDRRAARIVDRIIERGECDFVAELAAPLPLEIICDMMGIPESQSQFIFERSNKILGLGDPDYMAEGENPIMAAMGAGAELAGLMREMATARRKSASDDLTSALINATADEDVLTDAELASFFILLVVAGNETTRNAISHGIKALCDNPGERARWAADFEGLAPVAVEEIVRWSSPVIYMRRTLTRDYRMDDVEMREGDKVALWYASANRDADVFVDPFRFDITRTPNEHLGFGGPGPHYCLGANLARREITAMFRQIFERMPDLEITGAPERLASNFVHGIKRMPCRFTPGRVAA
ncbi:MAG: cytochrome P450 [Deltaproteobacteria bacterium]|jgi:cytochrome P450|nr:cytochrome P450 [Deltaproteobacteria bacterium]MBW2385527.1 cytochrome P450 [Deltaproteobacteria bacterium]MBW2695221.1 cytochrome P450 [Deltaproteobacteria bacterium]